MALRRFQGSEHVGARLWPLGAGFEIRQTRPCTVFGAQNPTTRAFGHLAQASKVGKRGPAPFSELRTQRPTFSDACRMCGKPRKAATDRFRGPESNGPRFRPLAAGLEIRQTRPCTVFGAQNPTAHVVGRLTQASKAAKGGPAPVSGLRTRRRASLAAWRRLRNPANAALHRFRGPEPNDACFWPFGAGFESRQTRPCTVFGAQNPTTHVFGRLPHVWQAAKGGNGPLSRPGIQRPTFSTACRGLGNPANAALHCFRGPEPNGARRRPLDAGFESRKRWPCAGFRAQNTSARVFGRLAQASKSGKRGPAPFSGPRTQRRVLLAIWRRLRKSANAALHRFRSSEPNDPRFRTPAACVASRERRQRTAFEARNPTAHVFDRLPRAWKSGKRGPALFSGPRTQRRTSSAA